MGNRPEPGLDVLEIPIVTTALIKRVILILSLTALFILIFLALWYLPDAFLVVFAGILLAVFLSGIADFISDHAGVASHWSLTLVIILFFITLIGLGWLFGPALSDGLNQLFQSLTSGITQLQKFIRQHGFSQVMLQGLQDGFSLTPDRLQRLVGIFSTALGTLTTFFFILIIGIYLCIEPTVYINGAVRLFPLGRRKRIHAVLNELGHRLRWWLVGRISSMAVVGLLTWLGLVMLGIPSALALALLAALLSFIPTIGPILSALPAVLIGLPQGRAVAFYVVLLYIVVQTIESYFVTPLIQRRTVDMPPALLLAVQLFLGVSVGILGLLLSGPLTVVLMALVQLLYLEDILGDSLEKQDTSPD